MSVDENGIELVVTYDAPEVADVVVIRQRPVSVRIPVRGPVEPIDVVLDRLFAEVAS